MSEASAHKELLIKKRHNGRGHWWSGLYIRKRFYFVWACLVGVTASGFLYEPFHTLGLSLLGFLVLATAYEYVAVSFAAKHFTAGRKVDQRLGLDDDNIVEIDIFNGSERSLNVEVLDELPTQLQVRDFGEEVSVSKISERTFLYTVRPKARGVYEFGKLLIYIGTPLKLIFRRYAFGPESTETSVYPSVLQMQQQTLRVRQLIRREGSDQKQRQFGRSYEFDQIKTYVTGDDYRLLNWKATARANALMINTYIEERSQQIVALVDCSRAMLSPFSGLSLLDYSINSVLALLNVAVIRGDRVGLLGFDRNVNTRVPLAARPEHMRRILEVLYRQKPTDYEADFDALYQYVRREVKGRSLLMLYTNFDTMVSLERNLPVLRQMARMHLLVIVLFVNDQVNEELSKDPDTLEEAYLKTIAAEHEANQAKIAMTLSRNGIIVMRTRPEELTANAVTQYLEVKKGGRL